MSNTKHRFLSLQPEIKTNRKVVCGLFWHSVNFLHLIISPNIVKVHEVCCFYLVLLLLVYFSAYFLKSIEV